MVEISSPRWWGVASRTILRPRPITCSRLIRSRGIVKTPANGVASVADESVRPVKAPSA